MTAQANGPTSRFEVGTERRLFPTHPPPARLDAIPYDVTSDGQRILVNAFVDEMTPPITRTLMTQSGDMSRCVFAS